MVGVFQLRNYRSKWETLMEKFHQLVWGTDEQKDAGEACRAFTPAQVK